MKGQFFCDIGLMEFTTTHRTFPVSSFNYLLITGIERMNRLPSV